MNLNMIHLNQEIYDILKSCDNIFMLHVTAKSTLLLNCDNIFILHVTAKTLYW
jgi:hypothetical protein